VVHDQPALPATLADQMAAIYYSLVSGK
jgi:adenylosuccinate lyase